tara:strand:- start:221 stop:430 length:210 start_codon:yes stop_codon:yes gene_type:complete
MIINYILHCINLIRLGTAIRGDRNVGVVCRRSARVLPVFRKLKTTVLILTWEAVLFSDEAVLLKNFSSI